METHVPVLILSAVVRVPDADERRRFVPGFSHIRCQFSVALPWKRGLKEHTPRLPGPWRPSGTEQGDEGVSGCTEMTLGSWTHTKSPVCHWGISVPETTWGTPLSPQSCLQGGSPCA